MNSRRSISIFAMLFFLGSPVAADTLLTQSGAVPTPNAGQGLVVFYRPGHMGALMGCTVHEGDAEIARLGANKYYAVPTKPGVHEYFTKGELNDRLRLEVEEEETYFVRCNVSAGNWGGRANLVPSDRQTFVEKAPSLHLWERK